MNDTQRKDFFDLHTTGIGYLNRARKVTPKQGDPYVSVAIAALRGRSDSPSYSYFDTIIVGGDAYDFVKKHQTAINDRQSKVLVRFKVGDSSASSYEVKSGDNAGNRNHLIKARLLQITWASINGEVVFEMPKTTQPSQPPVPKITGEDGQHDKPPTVELSLDDPYFFEETERLKGSGYCLKSTNSVLEIWELSQAA